MDKAVTYIQNRRSYLSTYLEDGRCSFSNNLSENAIRPFTVGRKNWLFCDAPNGAQASAIVYTMVEMAKANGVNVYHYLTYLLEKLPEQITAGSLPAMRVTAGLRMQSFFWQRGNTLPLPDECVARMM